MLIRKATIQDLELIVPLFNAYRIFYGKDNDLDGARKFISERLEHGESTIFIAFDEETKAIGFIQLYPLFSSTRMKRLWLLNDLYVEASARRKGFARALLDQAKQFSQETGAAGFFLETGVDNKQGNALYPAVGMTHNEESNFYYWNV